ncbi:1-acyl-sn-glycerol-3-phosphate acyltransferases [Ralstonia sp. 25mfcol4.1]|uniref:acyltransferase n=1 Tax=Burkholderiaceae TaxID=119060 RepID=UPI00087F94E7|nr:acyltransferase [Ralstonia sp. 25mfcol4.1]SDP51202.1 1-acyl-sn-glycerol-3-phosphate acyltransferases [Ralstonia sp. 25mfcol4.1]
MNSNSTSSPSARRAPPTGSVPPQPPQPVDTASRQPSKARPQRLAWLTGLLSATLLVLNTLACFVPIVPLALLKLAVPTPAVRRRVDPWLNGIATGWISRNTRWIARLQPEIWDVRGNTDLRLDDWYLVNCNHQSWVDIFVLQRVLNKRIPLLKFFLKQQLLYVPVIGLAWWALDFPFMKRYSKAQLRRNPALGRKDQETARRACEKFKLVPTSVMVFAEGTRFSEARRQAQSSPYRNLLKPRAGALATTLNAMGTQFRSMIDATIIYPDGVPSFWHLASGRAGRIVVRIRQIPIPDDFCGGDYAGDKAFRSAFHHWLADQWQAKDREIDAVMEVQRPLNADRD